MLTLLHDSSIVRLIQIALTEDIGSGDITSEYTVAASTRARARFVCKSEGVVCGLPVAQLVFSSLSDDLSWTSMVEEGTAVQSGTLVAECESTAQTLLAGERTALNFIQRMSGVATMAQRFVDAVSHTNTKILDTRKTIPAWRRLDKYAAQCGGAVNHRMGLYDMVMIKDNHRIAAGGIGESLDAVRSIFEEGQMRIEIECDDLYQVMEALSRGGFHRIMFDNFSLKHLREGVRQVAGKYETEASGGITLATVASVAECGVDYISTGAITHSANALDVSMEIELSA